MDIETSGALKLFFPNPSLPLVYFEALANALDAGATDISIEIHVQAYEKPDTLKITVTDNGSGFTDENFERFKTLLKPRDKFHKGLGRLVFLNYFNQVEVVSIWGKSLRKFIFKEGFDGNAPIQNIEHVQDAQTMLTFNGFTGKRVKSYDDLKPEAIKPLVIEQFLPTLYARKRDGKSFNIALKLKTNTENAQKEFFSHEAIITPDDLPAMTKVTIQDSTLDAFSTIDMLYHVEQAQGKGSLLVAFNIDGRTIPENIIPPSSFPAGYRGVFILESEIFHSNVDSSRQKLQLPDGLQKEILFRILRAAIGKVLAEKIPQIKERNTETKKKFEEQFPHLLGFFDDDTAGLIDRDDALTIAQKRFFDAQKEILLCEKLDDDTYEKSLNLSSRALTEYTLYRAKIIARLKEMSSNNSEKDIHNLIVPRYKEFSQSDLCPDIYQNNAWLLDDKFMAFRTILSEQEMDTIIRAIQSDEERKIDQGRPDITMIFSANPKDNKPVDVVVVEIKKKGAEEKDSFYAINQLLDRAVKLVAHCQNIQRVWYYAVIDINDTAAIRLRQLKWTPLFSKGKVYYQEFDTLLPDERTTIPTPIFVVSFDAIVADAESRNHTFLEFLRNSMKKYAALKNASKQ